MVATQVQHKHSVIYNPATGRYVMEFDGYVYEQRLCEFLSTFNFLRTIDLEYYLLNIGRQFDEVAVPLSVSGTVLSLPLADYVVFREMYMEEMFRLKLENMLHMAGVSPSV